MTIQLNDNATARISRHMATGAFDSPAAVVDAALDALDLVHAKTAETRQLIAEGDADLDAGRFHEIHSAAELRGLVKQAGETR